MSPPTITLAIGAETVLVERAVSAVVNQARRADPGIQRTIISAAAEDASHALREAAAPNLFGDAGIVIIEGVDGADDAMATVIRDVLADLPDATYLVFTHPGGTKGKALLDAIRAAGAEQVDCPTLKKGRSTVDFLTKEFARHKRKVTADAVAVMYEAIGHDLGLLCGAVSQLCADIEGDPITADAVHDYFAGVAEVSGFAIADAVWDRRHAEALRMLRQAMLASGSSSLGPATVASLASGLRTLVRVGGMPPGASEADVAREAGVPPWKVNALRRQWSRWSGDQRRLAAAAVALAEADAAMKGGVGEGTSLDADQKLLAMEILVAGSAR